MLLKQYQRQYLQQSVCVLPLREDLQQHLEKLKAEILSGGGAADLLTVQSEDAEQNAMLIQRFQQQADEEYQEFLGRCRALHKELDHKREIQNLAFAELDENEVELAKLRSWLPKIRDRGLCQAIGYAKAVESLRACEQAFELFSQQVYETQQAII